jgi:putative transposase
VGDLARPRPASADDNRPPGRSGWGPVSNRGIRAPQAAVADPQSDPETGAQSPPHGPRRCWHVCASHAPEPIGPCRDCFEAATLLRLHRALKTRKYRLLFSAAVRKKPRPRGPCRDVVAAVVEMKRRNPSWGCPRIAQQIALAFDVPINKDAVRRILAARYRPEPDSAGPSWLTVLGHAKDSLWSLDLFRCESAVLRTHWVLVLMDQFTRRIVGFGVHRGAVDGVGLCRVFNQATRGQTSPTYVSTDHDPPYRFHQWQRNLRILDVKEIKTVPYAPLSHPYIERLIGTIRRECLDCTLFRTTTDLEMKLLDFQRYYNGHRTHAGLAGRTPGPSAEPGSARATLSSYSWQAHCRGLYQTPIAA